MCYTVIEVNVTCRGSLGRGNSETIANFRFIVRKMNLGYGFLVKIPAKDKFGDLLFQGTLPGEYICHMTAM